MQKAASADRDEFAYTHDAVGNLTQEEITITRGAATGVATRGLVYDAFGRLMKVTDPNSVDGRLTQYRYNGLGHRTLHQWDADGDFTLEAAERRYLMYDERWRLVANFRDQDA